MRLRDEWLNPSDDELIRGGGKLKDRTLTNLYNKRPDWLAEAHRRLDAAVKDVYVKRSAIKPPYTSDLPAAFLP